MAFKPTKKQLVIGAVYLLFLVAFYFINIPGHRSFGTYALGFLVVSALYALLVWFVLKFLVPKPKA